MATMTTMLLDPSNPSIGRRLVSATSDIPDLLQVLFGGVLALVGAYVSTYFVERRQRTYEAHNLALAFRGELIAIQQLVKRRRYFEGLSYVIDYIKKTGNSVVFEIQVRKEYFNVFKANVDKIGILQPPLPELIVTFYTQANAMLEDLESIRDGKFGSDPKAQLQVHEDLAMLARETFDLADKIVEQIGALYPK